MGSIKGGGGEEEECISIHSSISEGLCRVKGKERNAQPYMAKNLKSWGKLAFYTLFLTDL